MHSTRVIIDEAHHVRGLLKPQHREEAAMQYSPDLCAHRSICHVVVFLLNQKLANSTHET